MHARSAHFETDSLKKALRIQALDNNQRTYAAKVISLKGYLERLKALLDDLNSEMFEASQSESPLAKTTYEPDGTG